MKIGLPEIIYYKDALIVAIRDMDIPMLDFFKRLDSLFLVVGYIGFFMGISIIYTVLTEILLKLFSKLSRVFIVTFLAVLSYILCLCINPFFNDYAEFILNIGILLGLISTVLIPTILLIITKVKKYEV